MPSDTICEKEDGTAIYLRDVKQNFQAAQQHIDIVTTFTLRQPVSYRPYCIQGYSDNPLSLRDDHMGQFPKDGEDSKNVASLFFIPTTFNLVYGKIPKSKVI